MTAKKTTKTTKGCKKPGRVPPVEFRFAKGNDMWKRAMGNLGRKPIFSKPEDIAYAANEYFNYIYENPLLETVGHFDKDGCHSTAEMTKMRAMTERGFCLHAGIAPATWDKYKADPVFSDICSDICAHIWNYKFEGASAGLLNHAIIARELGLAEKTDNTNTLQVIELRDIKESDCN